MATLEDGVIHAAELYTLERLKTRLGLTDAAYRELRDAGLPEVKRGKRKYFVGKHVIAWFAGEYGQDQSLRGAAAQPLDEPSSALENGAEVAGEVG